MKFQILVDNGPNELYTATVASLPDCRAQGATKQEAVAKVRQLLLERLSRGTIVSIDIPDSTLRIEDWTTP